MDTLIVVCDAKAKIQIKDPQVDRVVHLSELSDRLIAQGNGLACSRQVEYVGLGIRNMLDRWFGPLSRAPRIGDYVVSDSAFGHGDYSATYPAQSELLKTQVSLKVFRLDPYLPEDKLRCRRTLALRAANALMTIGEHPNIVRCHTPFRWEADKIILPLEWVDGPTLRDLLNEDLDWPISRRIEIFRQICEGLAHAHKHDVYHRALTPDNVVIVENDQVKLVGFDFAKIASEALLTRSSVGTQFLKDADRRYLAPEVAQNPHAASVSSDIFAAGAILFELVTGRPPFEDQIQKDAGLERLSVLASNCPSGIDEIFLCMCAYDPGNRYSSFADVLFDIQVVS